ncbi:MAG: CoA transferase [Myxococcota bacterium]
MSGALDGFRVIDATQVISGPVATRILGDQGADVIKVEPTQGDLLRGMGGGKRGMAPVFATANRNKRSVALDLRATAGAELVKRLVRGADVFVQNFRPGAAERLGIGEEALRAVNPELVYVSISGFGETGPYAHKRVYDPVIQAVSGLTAIQGGVHGKPQMMRLIVPDKVTALAAAQAITAALLARERTGRGQHVRLAMLDAVVEFMWPEGMAYHTFIGEDVAGATPPDRRDLVFETADGFMIAGTVAHREWVAFCQAVEKPEWLEDPRFSSTAGLAKYAEARLELMASVLATRTTAEWLEALDAAQVPCAPVLSRDELPHHPQIIENQLIVESEHPHAGRMRQARPATRFEGTPSALRRPAPLLGEHTDEVLAEGGLGSDEIARLRQSGVIR